MSTDVAQSTESKELFSFTVSFKDFSCIVNQYQESHTKELRNQLQGLFTKLDCYLKFAEQYEQSITTDGEDIELFVTQEEKEDLDAKLDLLHYSDDNTIESYPYYNIGREPTITVLKLVNDFIQI